MPSATPLALIFSRLIARSTSNKVNVMLPNLLSTLRSLVDGMVPLSMVPLSSVNLLEKTLCNNSAFIDELLVMVPLLFF